MCVITTSAVAGGLAAIGASTLAASTTAVAATTLAANAVIGAGLSAGIGAAAGARGRDLWLSAGLGAAGGGIGSGLGMAFNGVSTAAATAGTTLTPAQQIAAGATDVVPGAVNQGAEAHALAQAGGVTTAAAVPDKVAFVTPAAAGGGVDGATLAQMGLGLGGGAVEGYTARRAAEEDARALRDRARLEEIRAQKAREAAEIEKMDVARKRRQAVGAGLAAAAANGVMLESRAEAAPSVWEQDMMAELAWDQAKIDYNAAMEAWGHMASAAGMRRQAAAARRTGNMRLAAGLIKGGLSAGAAYYGGQAAAANRSVYVTA